MLDGGYIAASTSSVVDGQVQEEDGGISARNDDDEDARKGEPGCTTRGPEGGGRWCLSR